MRSEILSASSGRQLLPGAHAWSNSARHPHRLTDRGTVGTFLVRIISKMLGKADSSSSRVVCQIGALLS